VLVAASGPRALRLAGRAADGVILTVADPVFVGWCIEHVRAGLAEAGRDGDGFRVQVAVPGFVSDDIAYARSQTRWFCGFLGDHIAEVLREHPAERGNEELWRYTERRPVYDYRKHARPGGNPGDFVPDEVVDRFTLVGDAEATVARIEELEALGVTEINVYLSSSKPEEPVDAYGRDVVPRVSTKPSISTQASAHSAA
jgi:alkanesulfonate monooxygenase SsuD/methylene tetrahydromethanopterin reductase-like flavin-dependent oxidoreductase (luciferase family)